jgi:hypothetical protein
MNDEPERPKGDQPAEVLLRWIADDMKLTRQTLIRISSYIREAESEIPERVRRFMNYMHDVHDVKYMYEELGHKVPEHLLRELERLDDRYRQILKELHEDTGAFEQLRRKMAEDPENRWDHTRQLDFKGRSEVR